MDILSAKAPDAPGEADSPRRRLRVLLVEDSEDDFGIAVSYLVRDGWAVEARRVEDEPALIEALEHPPEGGWNVVISDHSLPRFNSTRAQRVVREHSPEIPFIIASGRIGEDVAVDAMLAGADDYVLKHNLTRLPIAVRRALDARELRRRQAAAERAERDIAARLAAIAYNLPGAVFELRYDLANDRAQFVYLTEGASRLTGLQAESILADADAFFRIALSEGESLAQRLQSCSRSGTSLRWEGRLAGGAPAGWIAVSASPRRTDPGNVLWDGIMMDVSALKEAEAGLRESRERLRELTAHWESRMEEERASIAHELHDDVGGTLSGLKVNLAWMRRHAPQAPGVAERLADAERLTDHVFQATARLSSALRPVAVEFGIVPALEVMTRKVAERLGARCRFSASDEELDLPPRVVTALYRLAQEALNNATKHARPGAIEVEIFSSAEEVVMEVRDDGCGFDAARPAAPDSFGIRGMRERVSRLGGWLEVQSRPGSGTTVMAGIPRQTA